MVNRHQIYSVYISDACVEWRSLQNAHFVDGRFIRSQLSYDTILKFAPRLAKPKKMPLENDTVICG